jgi:hypothetical protein
MYDEDYNEDAEKYLQGCDDLITKLLEDAVTQYTGGMSKKDAREYFAMEMAGHDFSDTVAIDCLGILDEMMEVV